MEKRESTISIDDEPDDGFKKPKPSMLYSAKKNIASKIGANKMGQDVIKIYLGDNGAMLASTLLEAATQDIGKEKAKLLLTYTYQMCLKAKILHDEKLITSSDRVDFVVPVNSISVDLYQQLDTSSQISEGEEEVRAAVDVMPLALKVAQLCSQVCVLLSKELREKSISKVKEVMGYFGGKQFLEQIFNNPEYSEFKARLTSGLFAIIKERLRQEDLLPTPRKCRTQRCIEDALARHGRFAGSLYCYACHVKQYNALVSSPSIRHFLIENGKTHQPIQLKIKSGLPANVPQLLNALYNYRQAKTPIRRIFAEGIYEKYFDPKCAQLVTCLKAETLVALSEAIQKDKAANKPQPEDLFQAVEDELDVFVQPFFRKEILESADYKQYLKSRKAPLAFSPDVKGAQEM